MNSSLIQWLQQGIRQLVEQNVLPAEDTEPQLTRTKNSAHGDWASNLALVLAKSAGMKPRDLAAKLVETLSDPSLDQMRQQAQVDKIEIAGPGFINFYLHTASLTTVVKTILQQGDAYGRRAVTPDAKRVLIEYVSANPTGPLHVGHGRGAAYGQSLSDLLEASGLQVQREYYVNDAGRQMNILAVSVWLRYLELVDMTLQWPFPTNGYQGEYVIDIAQRLLDTLPDGQQLFHPPEAVFAGLPADADTGGDKEHYIDALIDRAKTLLGPRYSQVFAAGLDTVLADIKDDLAEFGVHYQHWFSEQSLADDVNGSSAIEQAVQTLQAADVLYEQQSALWFRSTAFGDEKDRVVRRDNGQYTYFASDIAYHLNKLNRGFDTLIDVWGADHHGYIARVKAALTAIQGDATPLNVLLVQFAILYRGQTRVPMSTRSGEFVTLRELRHEVGNDAARFFYVMRKAEQHMDFDLELAKSQSNENPVYYVQYAHARVASVFRTLAEQQGEYDQSLGLDHLDQLDNTQEQALLKQLDRYTGVISQAAAAHEPHQLVYYLRDLATAFHSYYNQTVFLVKDNALRQARLVLISATAQVIRNALTILGVNAPERM